MFNIGTFELVALAVIALLVFGPDKLPKVAADAARLLRELRQMASGARRELSEALGPEFEEFKSLSNLTDLNPRTFVKKNLLDVLDDDEPAKPKTNGTASGSGGSGGGTSSTGGSAPSSGETPRQRSSSGFDEDTT